MQRIPTCTLTVTTRPMFNLCASFLLSACCLPRCLAPHTPLTQSLHPQLLKASGKEDERYPHAFDLKVTVTLEDESLTQELSTANTGK